MSAFHVLVLNCGSSSLKFAVLDAHTNDELISGLAEQLGNAEASLTYKLNGDKHTLALGKGAAHQASLDSIVEILSEHNLTDNVKAIGHRVVHGGEKFKGSVLIDDKVIEQIEAIAQLAPLHNPASLIGIRSAQSAFGSLPQVAVFDTAFHQSMPEHAYLYALPYKLYTEHGVRRYGFHGTSHAYVGAKAVQELNLGEQHKVITAHLGNGCSVCAIKDGKSVDTSMGLTPLEGLVMGTRSGDVDPGLYSYLGNVLGYNAIEVNNLLNTKSGLLGLSELSNDCRTIEEAYEQGHRQATLALEVFCYRLAKQIAAYLVPLNGLDALVFTGGIGENSSLIREKVIKHLQFLNMHIAPEQNLSARFGNAGVISTEQSSAKAVVIPTDEEWMICQDTYALSTQGA